MPEPKASGGFSLQDLQKLPNSLRLYFEISKSGGETIMSQDVSDLRLVFDFVKRNEWSSARQIGSVLTGGRSRANHFLYKYKEVLFVKRGLTPPQWRVASSDVLDRMLGGESRPSAPMPAARPKPKAKRIDWVRRSIPTRPSLSLPKIATCGSCGRPIQPSGKCGCS